MIKNLISKLPNLSFLEIDSLYHHEINFMMILLREQMIYPKTNLDKVLSNIFSDKFLNLLKNTNKIDPYYNLAFNLDFKFLNEEEVYYFRGLKFIKRNNLVFYKALRSLIEFLKSKDYKEQDIATYLSNLNGLKDFNRLDIKTLSLTDICNQIWLRFGSDMLKYLDFFSKDLKLNENNTLYFIKIYLPIMYSIILFDKDLQKEYTEFNKPKPLEMVDQQFLE